MVQIQQLKEKLSDVKMYWSRPPIGNYMPFKEIAAYSFGGIGAYFLIYVIQQMSLSVNNFLIGNVIGINPKVLYAIYVISVISSFPFTAIRANIIDNTRNKEGKYRPYLITMGIPTCILAIGFVMVPYEKIEQQWIKAAIVLLFNIGFQFFYMFFYDSYENLILVLSPNTQERTNVVAIKSIVYSLAPSIATAVIPIASQWLTGGSMTDLKLYRCLFPPFAIIGIIMSVVVFANTQEKIVQAKTHVVHIKFLDALRAVAKNKYFWIISLAGWLGFLESSYGVILQWLYQYRHACSPNEYAIIGLLYGNASFWGMLAAPFAIKKYGKKKVLIVTNFFNIIFISLMYPIIIAEPANMIWMVLICLWMNALVGSFAHILNPSINGDIRDYQQYVTGERIDGMFSTVGLIGSVITLCTSGVLPLVYEKCGINDVSLNQLRSQILAQETDLATKVAAGEVALNSYDVLYLNDVFEKVMLMLILLSVVGAFMNLLPYFFYDLSENKQRGMIKVLKIRSMFEDYGNGVLSDKDIVETIDIIREAESFRSKQPLDLKKAKMDWKAEKKAASTKEEKKAAKKRYRDAVAFNNNLEISGIVLEELDKFDSESFMRAYAIREEVYRLGLHGLTKVPDSLLAKAEALPQNTKAEKKLRKETVSYVKSALRSRDAILNKHEGKIPEFDASVFEKLFDEDDSLNERMTLLYKELHIAKKAKHSQQAAAMKAEIAQLKARQKQLKKEIKTADDANSVFNRLAKPFLDAKKLVVQQENYQHLDEIQQKYEAAVKACEEKARLEAEEEARLQAEKKAEKERLQAEAAAKKKK